MPLRDDILGEIYRACAPAAHRRALRLLGSDADAWDVVQEVFARLAAERRFEQIRARPMPYVYRATTNACLNALAARRLRQRAPAEVDDAAPDAANAVHARDLLEKLDAGLDDLDRQIIVLHFFDGLPQEDIAEVLDVWRRTVGRRLARLRALADALVTDRAGGAS